jgi:hypothetical protein
VSSYGRTAFTRGRPCLCPDRSPLYTLAGATCPGSSAPSVPKQRPRTWGAGPLCMLRPRRRGPRTRRPGSALSTPCLPWTLVTGAPPLAPSVPKVGAASKSLPCTAKLIRHKQHQCFISAHAAKGLLARPKLYAGVGGQG